VKKQIKVLGLFSILMAGLSPVMAVMPTAVSKGSGSSAYTSGSDDWLQLLVGYFDDGTDPLAWGVVIMTFIVVAIAVLGKYNDARRNPKPPVGLFGLPGTKTEWGEVWATAVIGAAVLLFVIFIATEGTQII
jgi:hypothetical protein